MIRKYLSRQTAGLCAAVALLGSAAPVRAQWTPVGNPAGISTSGSSYQYLTRDAAGNLYIAYQDSAVSGGSVQQYNGASWSYLGGAGVTAGNTLFSGLAVNTSGEVFYGYQDIASGNKLTVRRYTGGAWTNTWQNVTPGQAYSNSMKIGPGGLPYQVSRDLSLNGLAVRRFNGTGWARLGTAAFNFGGLAYYPSLVIGTNDSVYVSSVSPLSAIQVHRIHALTDSTTAWQAVGTTGFATTSTNSIFQFYSAMAIDSSNRLYVVYTSPAAEGNKLKVKKYESGQWSSVGADNFSPGSVSYVSIAVTPAGTPFVAFSDGSLSGRTSVMRFDGAQWVMVGTQGISAGAARYNSLALDAAGNPMVAFSDEGRSNRTVVMRFTPPCSNMDPGTTAGSTGCVSFTYRGGIVSHTTVRGADGNVWLQQNLGSSSVASSQTDSSSFGDTFQWGRWDDGHQQRNAATAGAPSPNDPSGISAGTSFFYTGTPSWWNGGALTDTWTAAAPAGVSSTNGCDPCRAIGAGWRLPTQAEWAAVAGAENMTTQAQAFASNLKLPMAGNRSTGGSMDFAGARGYYWSSTTSSTGAKYLYCGTTIINANAGGLRGQGMSIRCLKAMVLSVDSVRVSTLSNVPAVITANAGTLQLQAAVYPAGLSQNVTWSLTPVSGAASVSASGMVTAQSDGTVWVKAVSVADTLKSDSLLVSISNQIVPVDSMDVLVQGGGAATISTRGGMLQLQSVIYPAAAAQGATWSVRPVSGNATISNSGLVAALADGAVWAKATSVQNAAVSDSLMIMISNQTATGIDQAGAETMLLVYPDPADNAWYLRCGQQHPALDVTVTDLQGRVLLRRHYAANSLQAPAVIPAASCPPGVYLLTAEGTGLHIRRLIRRR